MDTDFHVWSGDTTVPSMVETHEASAKQEFKETTTDISNMEGSRLGNIRQGDIR